MEKLKKLIKELILKIFTVNPSLYLKLYLKLYEKYHKRIISFFGKNIYNGIHPKNIYNFRKEFFIQNLLLHDTVIDVGCGSGIILRAVASNIAAGYGIDKSTEDLAICMKDSPKNIKYIEADILEFNFNKFKKENNYNTAILSHILEHIENTVEFLKKIDADKLLICVPSQENWFTHLLISMGLPYFKDAGHFREYTREMLMHELHEAGYREDYIGFNSEGEIICKAMKK